MASLNKVGELAGSVKGHLGVTSSKTPIETNLAVTGDHRLRQRDFFGKKANELFGVQHGLQSRCNSLLPVPPLRQRKVIVQPADKLVGLRDLQDRGYSRRVRSYLRRQRCPRSELSNGGIRRPLPLRQN